MLLRNRSNVKNAFLRNRVGTFLGFIKDWLPARQNVELQIFLVTWPVCATLDGADLSC